MALQDSLPAPRIAQPRFGAALNDQRVRGVVIQVALVVALGAFAAWIIQKTAANLRAQGIPFGFGVLENAAGFQINQALISYSEASSYGRVYLVGLLNTLLVASIGIALATVLGFTVGIARLSSNWIVARLATTYVEVLRNTPLLLQIFVWYFGVLRLLPERREAIDLGPFGLLNVAGYYAPSPVWGEGGSYVLGAFGVGLLAALAVKIWARRRQEATGQQFPVFLTTLGLVVGLPLLVFAFIELIFANPLLTFEYPREGRFGPSGGLRVLPEFLGLLLALSTYTAAFIAEIVRAGILAVSYGQTEAAYSLGLRPGPTLHLVVVPQAMRIIIPPLTSQFLNLTKNSSLAVAIGYPDLVSVFAGTAMNQTGRAVEFILITMGTYLALSLVTSLAMNIYNRRMALVER